MSKKTSHKQKLPKTTSRDGASRTLVPKKSTKERTKEDQVFKSILTDRFCDNMKRLIGPIRDRYSASRRTRGKAEVSRTLSWHIRNQYRQQGLPTDPSSVAQGQRYVLRRIKALARKERSVTSSAKQRGGSADLNSLIRTDRRALSGSIAMMHQGNEDIVPINGESGEVPDQHKASESNTARNGCVPPGTITEIKAILDNDSDDWPPARCT